MAKIVVLVKNYNADIRKKNKIIKMQHNSSYTLTKEWLDANLNKQFWFIFNFSILIDKSLALPIFEVTRSQYEGYTFIGYLLLNSKFRHSCKILRPILSYFNIFENQWWVAANYEKNVTFVKNHVVDTFDYYFFATKVTKHYLETKFVTKLTKLSKQSKKLKKDLF